jgi:3-oxoacyl-(acyl-carrier-protein) synthase
MAIYINGSGSITPIPILDPVGIEKVDKQGTVKRLTCDEPDYSQFIDVKAIRRMSRIIKMGVTCSKNSMNEAGLDQVDAVIVGTALGCLEDTISFLNKLVINKEDLLNPTAFIHSTHNTISSQIALNLKCMGYNSTYVHRNLSFETALIDALLLFSEKSVQNVLVGGIDELTDVSFDILNRLGYYIAPSSSGNTKANGVLAGEGSAFFVLADNRTTSTYAELKDVRTLSFGSEETFLDAAKQMLKENDIEVPDLIFSGTSGALTNQGQYKDLGSKPGHSAPICSYKEICGEYPTATGFAMNQVARILKEQSVPDSIHINSNLPKSFRHILIHNNFRDIHQSLILLSAC